MSHLDPPLDPDHDPAEVAEFFELEIDELTYWHYQNYLAELDFAALCDAADRRRDW